MVLVDEPKSEAGTEAGELVERILDRAKYLCGEDRVVVGLLGNGKLSQRDVAQMLGVPESTLCRRVKRIWRKLDDPMVRALIGQKGELRDEICQLGIEHFLHGMSGPELADKHRMAVGEVRRIIWMVREWFNGKQSAEGRARR